MIELTEKNFEETKKGKVLIDCYAGWCGVCKMIKPKIEELEYKTDYKFYGLDAEKNEVLASMLNVSNLPTLILFEDGKETLRGSFNVLAELEGAK